MSKDNDEKIVKLYFQSVQFAKKTMRDSIKNFVGQEIMTEAAMSKKIVIEPEKFVKFMLGTFFGAMVTSTQAIDNNINLKTLIDILMKIIIQSGVLDNMSAEDEIKIIKSILSEKNKKQKQGGFTLFSVFDEDEKDEEDDD